MKYEPDYIYNAAGRAMQAVYVMEVASDQELPADHWTKPAAKLYCDDVATFVSLMNEVDDSFIEVVQAAAIDRPTAQHAGYRGATWLELAAAIAEAIRFRVAVGVHGVAAIEGKQLAVTEQEIDSHWGEVAKRIRPYPSMCIRSTDDIGRPVFLTDNTIDPEAIRVELVKELQLVERSRGAPRKNDDTGWPPDDGWHFLPGKYAFRREIKTLAGIPLKLLAFATATKAPFKLTDSDLVEAVWQGNEPTPPGFRSTLTGLRNHLRQEWGLKSVDDPLPCSDGAYTFNHELFNGLSAR